METKGKRFNQFDAKVFAKLICKTMTVEHAIKHPLLKIRIMKSATCALASSTFGSASITSPLSRSSSVGLIGAVVGIEMRLRTVCDRDAVFRASGFRSRRSRFRKV